MMDEYLIWSHEHGGWWGPERCGYGQSISKAGRYSREEAIQICTRAIPGTSTYLGALPELPVRVADVEALIGGYDERFASRPEPWR
jgi:hypothetical protein